MLILSRRSGETLFLTDDHGLSISVTVLGRIGNQTRIGIEAPSNIKILREEIINSGKFIDQYNIKREENEESFNK